MVMVFMHCLYVLMMGWVCRLKTMDCGMEQTMAMDQATTSNQRVRWTEERWEIGNTMALNLREYIIIKQIRVDFQFQSQGWRDGVIATWEHFSSFASFEIGKLQATLIFNLVPLNFETSTQWFSILGDRQNTELRNAGILESLLVYLSIEMAIRTLPDIR